jgi:hypothetical protein
MGGPGVGTVLFNMAANPVSGKLYVSNLESNNAQRFEGANDFAAGETAPSASVRGRIAFSRITVLDSAGAATPRHLNKHIDYDNCCAVLPNEANARSVAFPVDMAITGVLLGGITCTAVPPGHGRVAGLRAERSEVG